MYSNHITCFRLFTRNGFCNLIIKTGCSFLHTSGHFIYQSLLIGFEFSFFFCLLFFHSGKIRLVIFLNLTFTLFEKLCSIVVLVSVAFAENRNLLQNDVRFRLILRSFIYCCNGIDNVYTVYHFSENCMFSVQPWCWYLSDEKLGSIGVWTGIRHGKHPFHIMLKVVFLISKLVPRIAHTCSLSVATLDHEIRDHTVKDSSVIKWNSLGFGFVSNSSLGKPYKVSHCNRR